MFNSIYIVKCSTNHNCRSTSLSQNIHFITVWHCDILMYLIEPTPVALWFVIRYILSESNFIISIQTEKRAVTRMGLDIQGLKSIALSSNLLIISSVTLLQKKTKVTCSFLAIVLCHVQLAQREDVHLPPQSPTAEFVTFSSHSVLNTVQYLGRFFKQFVQYTALPFGQWSEKNTSLQSFGQFWSQAFPLTNSPCAVVSF